MKYILALLFNFTFIFIPESYSTSSVETLCQSPLDEFGFSQSPQIPINVKQTIFKNILPIEEEKGALLRNALCQWRQSDNSPDSNSPQQKLILDTIFGVGVGYEVLKQIKLSESEKESIRQKLSVILEQSIHIVQSQIHLSQPFKAPKKFIDFCAFLSGKENCSPNSPELGHIERTQLAFKFLAENATAPEEDETLDNAILRKINKLEYLSKVTHFKEWRHDKGKNEIHGDLESLIDQLTTYSESISKDIQANMPYHNWGKGAPNDSIINACLHWIKHYQEFPDIGDCFEYNSTTFRFINSPPSTIISIELPKGFMRLYDTISNTLVVKDPNNVPITMYKPDISIHHCASNLEFVMLKFGTSCR